MNKNTTVIIVIIIALLGVGSAVVWRSKKTEAPKSTTTQQNESPDTTSEPDADTTPEASAASTVEISNFAFAPASITVKKGTAVTWTNKDSVSHTVTPDEETMAFEGSELLAKDESYQFTFETAGTYTYHCQPHPQMKGTVIVTE
jgi:amicyanin